MDDQKTPFSLFQENEMNKPKDAWPSFTQDNHASVQTHTRTRAPYPFYFHFLLDNRTNAKTAVVMFLVFAILLCVFSILVAHHHNSGYYITGVVFASIALLVPVLRLWMHNAFPSLTQMLFWRTFYFTWETFVATSALLLFMKNTGAIAGTSILFVFAGLFTLYNISQYFTQDELRLAVVNTLNFREPSVFSGVNDLNNV